VCTHKIYIEQIAKLRYLISYKFMKRLVFEHAFFMGCNNR